MADWDRIKYTLEDGKLVVAEPRVAVADAKPSRTLDRLLEKYHPAQLRLPDVPTITPPEVSTPVVPDVPEISLPLDDEDLEINVPDVDDEELANLTADEITYPLVPRDYQMVASMFLRQKKRGMCTDDAGLGKTLTSAEAARSNLPVLVACPTYLTEQWYTFLTLQYPNDVVHIAEGTRKRRYEAIRTPADWYIVNHQMFRSYIMPDVQTLIIDEAHHFRNRDAQQTKALYQLSEDAPDLRIYMLTASPVYTSVDNLWSLLHILDPELFPSYNEFLDMYCTTMFSTYGPKVIGTRRTRRAELRKILDFVRIGRTYKEVGRYLPPIIGHAIKVQLPDDVRKLYNEVWHGAKINFINDEGKNAMVPLFSASAALHSMRAITAPAKIVAVADRLGDIPPNKKIAIVCWYKDTAKRMAAEIAKRQEKQKDYRAGGPTVVVTGELEPSERRKLAMSAHTVICTIGSLSEGVNLYHMRGVIFLEEHYSPGANYQVLRRVQRDRNDDGANREPILVWYVYTVKTADEIIHTVSRKRGAGAKEVLTEIFQE